MLQGKAQEVAARVVAEEEAGRRHLVVALSGAHAYGFPSPDSDLDIKAIHMASTSALLGLAAAPESASRMGLVDGVEVDYTSNELRPALAGILAGNGNYIERVLGALILHTTREHEQLRALMPGALSRRVHRHYRGFAANQRQALESSSRPTAKQLLYVLRTTLTGIHLLLTGELRVDLDTLVDDHGLADARELIVAKRAGERTVLDAAVLAAWLPRLDRQFELLDRARERSPLPEIPPGVADLEAWLIDVRTRGLVPSM